MKSTDRSDLNDPAFTETTPYAPNSPYAASKAASDHLVRAYFHTYGLPTLTTNCSNNYGPFQFPEKLIPLDDPERRRGKTSARVRRREERAGLALCQLIIARPCERCSNAGHPGEVYNIGGNNEIQNIDVVKTVCALLDEAEAEEGWLVRGTDHLM
jgi:dTDP-glucose 4,6-dehydratase